MQHIPQIIRRKISSERKQNESIDKITSKAQIEISNDFISIKDAVNIFGFSETFWRKAINQKDLKHYKLGGSDRSPIRLKKSDIISWFESYRVG